MDNKKTILAIAMHVGQNIGGTVATTVNIDKFRHIKMTEDAQGRGIWIVGDKCNKLVPFSNIQSVDYLEEGKAKPVAPAK